MFTVLTANFAFHDKKKLSLRTNDDNNHADQCNPNNSEYQGHSQSYSGAGTKSDLSNHANQGNSNHPSYQSSRKRAPKLPKKREESEKVSLKKEGSKTDFIQSMR